MKFSLSSFSPCWLLLVWFSVSESIDGLTALTPKQQRSAPSSSVLLYFSRTNSDNDNDDFLNSPNDINYDSKPENGQKLDYHYSTPAFDSFRKHSSKSASTLSAPSAPSTLLAKPTPYQWTLLKPLSQNSPRATESHHSSHRPKIVPYRHEFGLDVQNSPSHNHYNKNSKKNKKLKKTKLDKKKRPSKYPVDPVPTKTQYVKPVTLSEEKLPPGNSGQSITYFTMHEKDEIPENGDDEDEEEEEIEEKPKQEIRKVNNRNRPVEIKYRNNYQEQKPSPKIYKPNLGYQQQKTRPVWNPAGRINTKQLINQFNLISMTPLLQPSALINKNNDDNGKLAVLTSPFVVTKQNNQKYTLLNNQLIPLDTVTQALRQANMGQSVQRNPQKMEFGLISLLNNQAQRPELVSNDDYPQSQSGWYRNTIDTIDHGYDRQQQQQTPQRTYASLSPDFSPLAKVNQDKLRAATLETIGYLFS